MKTIIAVQFKNSSDDYMYFAPEEAQIKVNDQVVVFARNEFKCALVSRIRGFTLSERQKATKWIVQKVDLEKYELNMKKEEIAQEIKNQLRQEKEAMEELIIYQQLAKDNPKIATLLQELNTLECGEMDKKLLSK